MRKFLFLAGITAIIMAVFIFRREASARLTGTPPANNYETCFGAKSAEACIDSSGNVIPTTNNNQTSGSSSLQWSDVETVKINSGGALVTVGGALTTGTPGTANGAGTGNSTYPTAAAVSGIIIYTKSQVGSATGASGIYQSTTVPVMTSYEILLGSGTADILLTSTPNISTTTTPAGATNITDGTFLVLSASQTTSGVIFQDNATLSGSGVKLGSTSRKVTGNKVLTLIFNAGEGLWDEVSYGNN